MKRTKTVLLPQGNEAAVHGALLQDANAFIPDTL